MKKWVISNSSKINSIVASDAIEGVIKILLENRGLKSQKEINEFLNPSLDDLTLQNVKLDEKELNKAKVRIKKAIEKNETIVVYTDYDADGVSSGTIVWEALYHLGAKVMPYVPHRIEEGYGLSNIGIDNVKEQYNPSLIITVDHGVSAYEKVGYAKKLGIDVIIIDHHTLPAKLPEADALIHTVSLCATGIAWFFANYLKSNKMQVENLDLVALATIADLIPLTHANRILVKYGLEQLNKTKRPGLLALMKTSGIKDGNIGVYEVGHLLAPRINASGRLTHALDSLRLLCTKDRVRAELLAQNLSSTNKERQLLLKETTQHAFETVKKYLITDNDRVKQLNKLIFISHENYNQGVIGLVAGKLVEEYYRPAIVISKGEKYSKASARSIAGFNIVEAIRSCSELLVDVGGHPMAAGFTIETSKLLLLEKKLTQIADKSLDEEKLQRTLKIDCEIDLEQVIPDLYKAIKNLEPFGMGNAMPTFVSRNVKMVKIGLVGKDKKHLKFTLQPNPKFHQYIDAIGFGMSSFFEKFSFDQSVDIVYTIEEDNWNMNRNLPAQAGWSNLGSSLQLKLKDVKISLN